MPRPRTSGGRLVAWRSAAGLAAVLLIGLLAETRAQPSVEAEQGSVAAGRDIRDTEISIGIQADELGPLITDIMRDERARHQTQLEALSRELAVTDEAVINFLDPT